MGMVWDYAMLCYKAIYAFNQYAINRFRLIYIFSIYSTLINLLVHGTWLD